MMMMINRINTLALFKNARTGLANNSDIKSLANLSWGIFNRTSLLELSLVSSADFGSEKCSVCTERGASLSFCFNTQSKI